MEILSIGMGKIMAIRRYFPDDEEGVSEVVGSILTLAITVVLFSSVFAAVTQIEPPEEKPHSDLTAEYEYADDRDYINITHDGGKPLDTDPLSFMLLVGEDHAERYEYKVDHVNLSLSGDDNSTWSIGEEVQIKDNLSIPDPFLELWIRNEYTDRIIYRTVLLEEDLALIDVRDARVDYRHEWRDHANQEEKITIRAEVVSPVYRTRGKFDPEDLSVSASIYEDGVLRDEGGPIAAGEEIELDHISEGEFMQTVWVTSTAEYASYSLKISAESDVVEELSAYTYIGLNVGEEAAERHPSDLVVGDIRYDPDSPSHHDEFQVEVDVYNRGPVNYTAGWDLTDNGVKEYSDTETFSSGPAPTVITARYDITGVGRHEIVVNLNTTFEDPWGNEIEDSDPMNNRGKIEVYVDPNILVVRDVTARDQKEAGLMTDDLFGLNFDYGIHEMDSEEDHPTEEDLMEYSIVIWLTGESDEDDPEPLFEDAQAELVNFIENHNGKLWLMGSNLEHVDVFRPSFLDKLGLDEAVGEGDRTLIDGELANPERDKNGTYGDHTYPVYQGVDAYDLYADLESDYLPKNTLEDDQGDIVGVGYDAGEEQRTAVNSFSHGSISEPAARADMTQEVIRWLGGIDKRSGVDVAVSSQRIEPTTNPMYRDEIEIKATLRNNGPEDLNVTVRCVRNQGEEILEPRNLDGPFLELSKMGGTAEVRFTWTADELGDHEFLVVADYYDEIDEVNLENNDIQYKNLDITEDEAEVTVHYSTLVVDAALPEQQGDTNPTEEIVDSFERFGLEEGVDYDRYHVENDDHGPSADEMSNYNAVYWVTGEREDPVFTGTDIDNLKNYLDDDRGANIIFIGKNILSYLEDEGGDADELIKYMGVNPDGEFGTASPSHLIGQDDSQLGRALKYELLPDVEVDTFKPLSSDHDGEAGVLFKDEDGNNLASTYDDGSIKTVYMGVGLEDISTPIVDEELLREWPAGPVNTSSRSARDEFVYTSLWYFGFRYDEVEFRVTDYDIELSSDHPEMGHSYEVTVEIENVGYEGASTMVRLKEGDDHIGTQSVRVGGSERTSESGSTYFQVEANSTTAGFTWQPVFGGERPLRVKVDPLGEIEEIEGEEGKIMEYNNHATVVQPVYYFYDDMERGDRKWSHDSTMLNIDGSSPLDFMSSAKAENTEVEDDWDWSMSGSTDAEGNRYIGEGVYNTTDLEINEFTDNAYYSPPRSYWMGETPGDPEAREREPLDLVLLIDDGATSEYLDHSIDAAVAAVEMLQEDDRVAALTFGAGQSWHNVLGDGDEIFVMIGDEGDKQDIITDLEEIGVKSQQKNFFDVLSAALYGLQNEEREDEVEAVEGIISFTDGVSNQDGRDEDPMVYTSTGDSEEPDQRGPVEWFEEWDDDDPPGPGLLGIPYNILTITVDDRVEPRKHWVSATSTGEHSYGIFERETEKLEDIFQLYVSELYQSARGDLRSAPVTDPPEEDDHLFQGSSYTIEDTEFFVYSDAFTTGGDLADEEEWKGGDRIPAYGVYDEFDFEHVVQTADKGIPGRADMWIVVENDTAGAQLANTVHPEYTFDRLDGEHHIKEAYANMYIETHDDASLELRIIQNDEEFVKTGITADHTPQGDLQQPPGDDGAYINIPLKDDDFEITDSEPFDFVLEHEGGGNIVLDDISFTYEIDFYPKDYEYEQELGGNRTYRYMTTPSVNLGEVEELNSASLEFLSRYWLTGGTTGGFIYLWGKEAGEEDWSWEKDNRLYVEPEQSYTGNLDFDRIVEHNEEGGPRITGDGAEDDGYLEDLRGNLPNWVFNGKSADRTFDWKYHSVNIGQYQDIMEENDFDEVRAVFMLTQFGGIIREDGWEPEMGWYLDNVRFKISSEWEDDGPGYWNLTSASRLEQMGITEYQGEDGIENYYDRTHDSEDGKYWIFTSEDGGEDRLPQGVDSSLYTRPIYLDNARNPRLTAHMKFNIDDGAGLPPSGFRIEVSDDDGRTWDPLTSGARAGSGASGDDEEYGWIDSGSLSRVHADLSGWRDERIILRFRVFTNLTERYADPDLPRAIFIDDVWVVEEGMEAPSLDNLRDEGPPPVAFADDNEHGGAVEEDSILDKNEDVDKIETRFEISPLPGSELLSTSRSQVWIDNAKAELPLARESYRAKDVPEAR